MKFNILRTHGEGVTSDAALKLTKKMLTNKQADDALQNYLEEVKKVDGWFWTATHISYKAGSTEAEVWNEGEKKKTRILLPLNDGWYLTEGKYGIPCGEKSDAGNPKARYLIRYQRSDFIGLVSRDYGRFVDLRRYVGCYVEPYYRLGVVESTTGNERPVKDAVDWKAKYEALRARMRAVVEEG